MPIQFTSSNRMVKSIVWSNTICNFIYNFNLCDLFLKSSSFSSKYIREKTFDFVGSLTLVPYCMDHEGNQVVSFTCLPTKPNCIVLLLTSGLIYHCIFMPNIKYNIYESSNVMLFDYLYFNRINNLNERLLNWSSMRVWVPISTEIPFCIFTKASP